ncbi:MAG: hypothetical protein KGQ58_08205 [Proteobacteria bacterium]|nr:hypothetical protein [Pseudomonadota bacterium]MDE3207934.1 hypothetical protein [Pseudomonadota bacterium]
MLIKKTLSRLLCDGGEVFVPGEVVPYQPIGILVRAVLPGRIGMSKTGARLPLSGNHFMRFKFLSVVHIQNRQVVSHKDVAHSRDGDPSWERRVQYGWPDQE